MGQNSKINISQCVYSKGKELFLDTHGACFLCLHEISSDIVGDEEIKEFCLRNVCRYLKIKPSLILLASLEESLLAEEVDMGEFRLWDKCDFSVKLCNSCLLLVSKLDDLICQMEHVKLLTTFQLQLFGRALERNEDKPDSLWDKLKTQMTLKSDDPMEARLVENLRCTAKGKSLQKLKKLQIKSIPKVQINRLHTEPDKNRLTPSKILTTEGTSESHIGVDANFGTSLSSTCSGLTEPFKCTDQQLTAAFLPKQENSERSEKTENVVDQTNSDSISEPLPTNILTFRPDQIKIEADAGYAIGNDLEDGDSETFEIQAVAHSPKPSCQSICFPEYTGQQNQIFLTQRQDDNDTGFSTSSCIWHPTLAAPNYPYNDQLLSNGDTYNSINSGPVSFSSSEIMQNRVNSEVAIQGREQHEFHTITTNQNGAAETENGRQTQNLTLPQKPSTTLYVHNEHANNFSKGLKDIWQICKMFNEEETRTVGNGSCARFRCLVCSKSYVGTKIKIHLTSCHPEIFFGEDRLENVTQEVFKQLCSELLLMETKVVLRIRNDSTQGNIKIPSLVCTFCNKIKHPVQVFKYHLVSDHYDILQKKLIRLQEERIRSTSSITEVPILPMSSNSGNSPWQLDAGKDTTLAKTVSFPRVENKVESMEITNGPLQNGGYCFVGNNIQGHGVNYQPFDMTLTSNASNSSNACQNQVGSWNNFPYGMYNVNSGNCYLSNDYIWRMNT